MRHCSGDPVLACRRADRLDAARLPLALGVLAAAGHAKTPVEPRAQDRLPAVSLIVAAHDEQTSIGAKVANALALDYPRELLEVIVACDGCEDGDR